MKQQPEMWALRIQARPEHESPIEEAFAQGSVATSTLIGENGLIILEILFQEEPPREVIQSKLSQLEQLLNLAPLPYKLSSLGRLDWIKEVAGNFPPLNIGRWTVFGAAYRDQVASDTLALQIDATSAFGTGEHPTTRGCLILLDELLTQHPASNSWKMLDMGCGSGILAMAFAKATVGGYALGIDMDEDSVEIANENLAVNNLKDRVHIATGEGYHNPIIGQHAPYDLIMANVFARPLCEMAPDLKHHLKINGHVILSGILNDQADAVLAAHRQQGLDLIEHRTFGEWSVLALRGSAEAS